VLLVNYYFEMLVPINTPASPTRRMNCMKQQNIKGAHHSLLGDGSSKVMRAPIDQYHSLELTFSDGADTQYRVVTRDLISPE
jgi:hypothetical protein